MKCLILFAVVITLTSNAVPSVSGNKSSRIIGGNDTTIRAFPSFAAILFRGVPICGGVLIRNSAILTTASCLSGYHPQMLHIQLGSSTPGDGEIVTATRFCTHPLFNISGPAADYDVSVVFLGKYIYTSTAIQTISIRSKYYDIPAGRIATVVGFGTSGFGGPRNKVLQALELPRVRDITCQRAYPHDELSDRMFCFGNPEGGKDSCNAGGSPLYYGGAVVGLDSWSYGCAFPNTPRVFTKLNDENIYDQISRCT